MRDFEFAADRRHILNLLGGTCCGALLPTMARATLPAGAFTLEPQVRARTGVAAVQLDQEGNGTVYNAASRPLATFATTIVGTRQFRFSLSRPSGGALAGVFTLSDDAARNLTIDGALNGERVHATFSPEGAFVGPHVAPKLNAKDRNLLLAVGHAAAAHGAAHAYNGCGYAIVCTLVSAACLEPVGVGLGLVGAWFECKGAHHW